MSQGTLETERVVQLLLRDTLPQFGDRARVEVGRLAANHAALANAWIQAGQALTQAQRDYEAAVVEGLQEAAHDLHWDTTWPACPRHGRHPLWYDATRQAWSCTEDPSVVVPLGRLSELHRLAP